MRLTVWGWWGVTVVVHDASNWAWHGSVDGCRSVCSSTFGGAWASFHPAVSYNPQAVCGVVIEGSFCVSNALSYAIQPKVQASEFGSRSCC